MFLFGGWGSVGHKIINKAVVPSFPYQMSFLSYWSDSITSHASDADNRKNADPKESPKHFIDIDEYPEFIKSGRISQNYDSVVAGHSLSFVIDNGTLPWTIVTTCDSLKAELKRRDWQKAMLTAADLGHYVGDAHMPLHITRNYNGQYSNQSGVHSRYETTLIGKYQSQLVYTNDTASYIESISDFAFNTAYSNYNYVDSVLYADSLAKALTGSTSSSAYYTQFWNVAGAFTLALFKHASKSIADLIYTCWIDSGSPTSVNAVKLTGITKPESFNLFQNYPNPFNPSTTIKYSTASDGKVDLVIYNQLGQQVAQLVNQFQKAGTYSVNFTATGLASGAYFCQLKTGNVTQTNKILLLK